MVPMDHPGPVYKWLFKIPVLFYKLGIPPFGDFILLLTTTGRKSGKLRFTPLEYRRETNTRHVIITAGWGGHTDWRCNIRANPRVCVQIGRNKYEALAEPLSDAQVAAWMADTIRINPRSAKMFSRWAGKPVGIDEPESLLDAARFFPSFRLRPFN
jgi:deazaflavin-dependent oxidoreductase (nitroreductase family)